MTLIDTIPCNNTLGEGVQWNHQDGCFWWTDILSAKMYRYYLNDKHLTHWDLPERLCCFAFAKHDARILAGNHPVRAGNTIAGMVPLPAETVIKAG